MVSVNQLAIVSGMLVVYFVNYFIASYGAISSAWTSRGTSSTAGGGCSAPGRLPAVLFFAAPVPRARKPALAHQARPRRRRPWRSCTRVGGATSSPDRNGGNPAAVWPRRAARWRSSSSRACAVALVIGVVLAVLQQITGINVVLYYCPEIFKKTGRRAPTRPSATRCSSAG